MPSDPYADLYFKPDQLFLSADETRAVAMDFFARSPDAAAIADIDRAFIQRALLIAVDKSEKAGMMFDLFSSVVKAAPSKSVQSLVRGLATKAARRWFKKYIDDTPKVSAVGKSAVQYSLYASQWRLRVGMDDTGQLTNDLIAA